ncbi:unnamed protein product [Gordionus sp. m RMFG-2023]|uniref:kelch repeat and BTB domain-containing protein 8-like n=1 Tax=Gordionus sp. m RMFG-2023 TaxID=3053472 RepID=UPI0030DFEAC2
MSTAFRFMNCPYIHSKCILNYSRSMLFKKKLLDTTLDMKDNEIKAHRLILAYKCNYIHQFLEKTWKEILSISSDMVFRDAVISVDVSCEKEIVDLIINYLYTGTIIITESNACKLYQCCKIFELNSLEKLTISNIINFIDDQNALEYLGRDISDNVNNAALGYLCNNFQRITSTKEFLECSLTTLEKLIDEDDIKTRKEIDIFESVVRWLEFSVDTRKIYSNQVFSHIRFCLMSTDELIQAYDIGKIFFDDKSNLDFLVEAAW